MTEHHASLLTVKWEVLGRIPEHFSSPWALLQAGSNLTAFLVLLLALGSQMALPFECKGNECPLTGACDNTMLPDGLVDGTELGSGWSVPTLSSFGK